MGRFFRPASKVDDSVNKNRLKSFIDRIGEWGSGPGMATPVDVTGYNSIFQPGYSPSNYGGARLQEVPIPVQEIEQNAPEVANQTSFPLSDAFYMKNGRLYASDTVAGYSKEHRRGLLDEYLKRFPDAQAGVDAWSKRTPSGTKAPATGVKRPHPGTPSTSGDWTGEQKPISAPPPLIAAVQPPPLLARQTSDAKPAPVRASGGARGGVALSPEEASYNNYREWDKEEGIFANGGHYYDGPFLSSDRAYENIVQPGQHRMDAPIDPLDAFMIGKGAYELGKYGVSKLVGAMAGRGGKAATGAIPRLNPGVPQKRLPAASSAARPQTGFPGVAKQVEYGNVPAVSGPSRFPGYSPRASALPARPASGRFSGYLQTPSGQGGVPAIPNRLPRRAPWHNLETVYVDEMNMLDQFTPLLGR